MIVDPPHRALPISAPCPISHAAACDSEHDLSWRKLSSKLCIDASSLLYGPSYGDFCRMDGRIPWHRVRI